MSVNYECYFENIPVSVETKLIELYKTPFCTIRYIKLFDGDNSLNCFSIYDENSLIHLIIFKIDQRLKTIYVLNKLFEFESNYLKLFSDFIFKSKYKIDKIQINYLKSQICQKINHPYICRLFVEDYFLKLPDSNSQYLSKLSSNMRRHTKNYISRIERTFGSYSFRIFEKVDITDNLITKIVEMNHQRMNSKKIVSGIDRIYTDNIIEFSKAYGFICVLEINDEIVAGLICYSIKNNYIVETVSNNPKYDQYNVGHTCLYFTIQECIRRNGNEFHLLWGNNPYKKRFLAERLQLYSVTVFRTPIIKMKFKWMNEILPCISYQYQFKLFKREIKKLIGEKRIENLRRLSRK